MPVTFDRPIKNRCCICGRSLEGSPKHIEWRPTGPNRELQRWTYDIAHWREHARLVEPFWKLKPWETLFARVGLADEFRTYVCRISSRRRSL